MPWRFLPVSARKNREEIDIFCLRRGENLELLAKIFTLVDIWGWIEVMLKLSSANFRNLFNTFGIRAVLHDLWTGLRHENFRFWDIECRKEIKSWFLNVAILASFWLISPLYSTVSIIPIYSIFRNVPLCNLLCLTFTRESGQAKKNVCLRKSGCPKISPPGRQGIHFFS